MSDDELPQIVNRVDRVAIPIRKAQGTCAAFEDAALASKRARIPSNFDERQARVIQQGKHFLVLGRAIRTPFHFVTFVEEIQLVKIATWRLEGVDLEPVQVATTFRRGGHLLLLLRTIQVVERGILRPPHRNRRAFGIRVCEVRP